MERLFGDFKFELYHTGDGVRAYDSKEVDRLVRHVIVFNVPPSGRGLEELLDASGFTELSGDIRSGGMASPAYEEGDVVVLGVLFERVEEIRQALGIRPISMVRALEFFADKRFHEAQGHFRWIVNLDSTWTQDDTHRGEILSQSDLLHSQGDACISVFFGGDDHRKLYLAPNRQNWIGAFHWFLGMV